MPTYHATGVTATLATCDLQPTLSKVIDWCMGRQQQTDATRVQQVFGAATKLHERPIGEDGSDKGIVRFIGVNGDMALFMVEAGERVGKRTSPVEDDVEEMEVDEKPDSARALFSDDSPLTSLGATPTLTPTQQSFDDSPPKVAPAPPHLPLQPALGLSSKLGNALHSMRSYFDSSPQALVLDIEVSPKSFRSASNKGTGGASTGTDLKVEVFINGELADVAFVNARRSAVQLVRDKIRFCGTRLHRQIEKPWVYAPSDQDAPATGAKDAERRWTAISDSLVTEAEARGHDRLGDMPPSGEFLMALAALELPERVRSRDGIGIVDVVITAGKGRKYGPETNYITGPTRMDDPDYNTSNPVVDPALLSMPLFRDLDGISPLRRHFVASSSPDIPLSRTRQSRATFTTSPTPKKNMRDLTAELGVTVNPKKISLEAYENSKGKLVAGRTLGQRLGDVKKMSETNQAKEMERLREELGVREGVEPVKKKVRRDSKFSTDVYGLNMEANPFVRTTMIEGEGTFMDPMQMFKSTRLEMIEAADPEAVLTQNRIDLALSEGAASNGHLLRRIASTSPQHTPKRKTKASSLANSPTFVAIKEQRRTGPPKTPQHSHPEFESPLSSFTSPNTMKLKMNTKETPTRSGPGERRSAGKWRPSKPSTEDVLKDFEVPKACKGSCVTFAEDENAQRQIGKARRGEFREETLLVGMRFVVV